MNIEHSANVNSTCFDVDTTLVVIFEIRSIRNIPFIARIRCALAFHLHADTSTQNDGNARVSCILALMRALDCLPKCPCRKHVRGSHSDSMNDSLAPILSLNVWFGLQALSTPHFVTSSTRTPVPRWWNRCWYEKQVALPINSKQMYF